ncbi:unnamed protein product [Ixodes pacificus]
MPELSDTEEKTIQFNRHTPYIQKHPNGARAPEKYARLRHKSSARLCNGLFVRCTPGYL